MAALLLARSTRVLVFTTSRFWPVSLWRRTASSQVEPGAGGRSHWIHRSLNLFRRSELAGLPEEAVIPLSVHPFRLQFGNIAAYIRFAGNHSVT